MEQRPHDPGDDHDRDIPELERLWPGEIDMTGVVRQDDALVDVIGDAIGEAEAEGGEVPEWGARTLARALANERDDPQSGALHHFAVTGRVDPGAISRELADIYERVDDEEIREWINWLGTYIINLGDDESKAKSTEPPRRLESEDREQLEKADVRDSTEGHANESTPEGQSLQDDALSIERASAGGPAAQFTEHLKQAAAEADARGETLALEDVQAVAAMLAGFLVTMGVENSAMIRLAETGESDLSRLKVECQQLKSIAWKIADVHIWVHHLERHLFAN
jgi:hypothetical protein